jgi:hypothetical protein
MGTASSILDFILSLVADSCYAWRWVGFDTRAPPKRSLYCHILPLFIVFLHSRRHICIFPKGGCTGIFCVLQLFCIISYHGVLWWQLPIILATIQRPILRFIYDIVICGQRLEGEKEESVSTFLCIMRSAEYDLGRCSHQSDDDILFKQSSPLLL